MKLVASVVHTIVKRVHSEDKPSRKLVEAWERNDDTNFKNRGVEWIPDMKMGIAA